MAACKHLYATFFVEVPMKAELCDEPKNAVFNCNSIHPAKWRLLTRIGGTKEQRRIDINDPALPESLKTIINDPIVKTARMTHNSIISKKENTGNTLDRVQENMDAREEAYIRANTVKIKCVETFLKAEA